MPTYYALRRIDDPALFVTACTRGKQHLILAQTRQQALELADRAGLSEFAEPAAVIPAETPFSRYYFNGQLYTKEEI